MAVPGQSVHLGPKTFALYRLHNLDLNPAMGDEATGLMGVWLLRSAYLEQVDDGEKIFQYGDAPFP
jgi:hypothetical protein